MKKITDLTNYVSNEIGAENCLVIGNDLNTDLIEVNSIEVVEDSNAFFKDNSELYDIIIVDGYHSYEQSKKDLENALESVTDKGLVLVHDSFPYTISLTGDRKNKVGAWCGDVYKTVMEFRQMDKVSVITWDKDYGVSIVSKNKLTPTSVKKLDLTFDNLHKYPIDSVGLANTEQIKEYFNIFLEISNIDNSKEDVTLEESISEELTKEEIKEMYKKRYPERRIGRKSPTTLLREMNE